MVMEISLVGRKILMAVERKRAKQIINMTVGGREVILKTQRKIYIMKCLL